MKDHGTLFGDRLKQVRDQYIVVSRLAECLQQIADDNVRLLANVKSTSFEIRWLNIKGRSSAAIMETIGDILNGMDAADDSDAWMEPVFENARRMFPRIGAALEDETREDIRPRFFGPGDLDDACQAIGATWEFLDDGELVFRLNDPPAPVARLDRVQVAADEMVRAIRAYRDALDRHDQMSEAVDDLGGDFDTGLSDALRDARRDLNATVYYYDKARGKVWDDPDKRGDGRPRERASFQHHVRDWMLSTFGLEITHDTAERNFRFLEESLELCQAAGMTREQAGELVDYVFAREPGDVDQEIGGVMVTLAALCIAHGSDMESAGERELERISDPIVVERIRRKHASKPIRSPLPGDADQPIGHEWKD